MKKLMVLLSLLILVALSVNAQKLVNTKKQQTILALSGGPSIPVGVFGETSSTEAGMAKTGYNFNLHFNHSFNGFFGIATTGFYSQYAMNVSSLQNGQYQIYADHWQFYGVTTGPMFSFNETGKWNFDFRVGLGAANVNFPVLKVANLVSNEKWATAFTAQFGTDARYNFSSNGFILAAIDLTAMRPETTITIHEAGSFKVHQDIDVIDFGIGIGFNF
jgi:hypothetical protein